METTDRWGFNTPEGTGDSPDVPFWMRSLAVQLDGVAMDDQGLLGSRPTSTPGTPGKKGRYYYATDTGQLFRDTGTAWVELGLRMPGRYFAQVPGTVTTSGSGTGGGPTITVTLERDSWVSVYAIAHAKTPALTTRAHFYVLHSHVGQPVSGEGGVHAHSTSVKQNVDFFSCVTTSGGAPTDPDVVNRPIEDLLDGRGGVSNLIGNAGGWCGKFVTAGTHTFDMRYSMSGTTNTVTFSNRRMWIKVEEFPT